MENKIKTPNLTGIRIKEMRLENDWTQKDLANRLGLKNDTAIANYESGYSVPKDDIKLKMCELFNCSMDYLMGENDFKNFEELKNSIIETYEKNFYEIDLNNAMIAASLHCISLELMLEDKNKIKNFLENESSYNIDALTLKKFILTFETEKQSKVKEILKEIIENMKHYKKSRELYSDIKECIKYDAYDIYMAPVYGRISAGQPNWAEECIEGRIPIDPDHMNITEPTECFFLKVNGESMNKEIKNGAYALIRRTDFVENGEIAVVLVNGYDATLKKFSKQGDLVILEPMSNDPSFTTQVYGKDTEIKVIGKYIGKMEMK